MRLILIAIWLLVIGTISFGQSKLPGQWSLALEGSFSLPASSSMNGTLDDFENDIAVDYNNKTFPFGDSRSTSFCWGIQLAYQFPVSRWSLYATYRKYSSHVDNGYPPNVPYSQQATLITNAIEIGYEYVLYKPLDALNIFGKVGVTLSFINGEMDYYDALGETQLFYRTFHTEFTNSTRGGFNVGFGAAWNIPSSPASLEATISYFNSNAIGKSYEIPESTETNTIRERGLNDAKNPADPSDHSRAIAYLTVGMGFRVWF